MAKIQEYQYFSKRSVQDAMHERVVISSYAHEGREELIRSEFKIINLYESIVGWFCNDQRQFRVSSAIVPGSRFGWGGTVGNSRLTLSRWVPNTRSGIEEIAHTMSCGAYTVLPRTDGQENVEFDNSSEFDVISAIHEIYERACWDYDGPELPKPSRLVGWKGHLAWFEKCRDVIGATDMLKAYVAGVPLEDIVLIPMVDEQELWYMEKWKAGGYEATIKAPHFPNMNSKKI